MGGSKLRPAAPVKIKLAEEELLEQMAQEDEKREAEQQKEQE